MDRPPRRILPAIIISQFAGTSLWFAGNAVLPDLQRLWGLSPRALGYMTSSVQLGFIAGTLVFAVLAISDVFSPRKIFLICSLIGAFCNAGVYLFADGLSSLMVFRFLTGFFLAGIYPVGMKIAAGWYQQDLGRALGYLVAALVLGTAFPHLLKAMSQSLPWSSVILTVSAIAAFGGLLMVVLVPDGPYLAKGSKFDPGALKKIFQSKNFRSSAFGYFGHMWELYAHGSPSRHPSVGVSHHRGWQDRVCRGRYAGRKIRRRPCGIRSAYDFRILLLDLAVPVFCPDAGISVFPSDLGDHCRG